MNVPGLTAAEVRALLEREIGKSEASTKFYWESEELEEAVDLLVDAVAKVVAANNKKVAADLQREARQYRG